MREEDEIRAAVVALAEAQAAGGDVSADLPHGEALAAAVTAVDGEDVEVPTDPDEVREEALAAVFDAVRRATRASRLSQPCDWEASGLVPPSMTAEDVEMAVYDRLVEAGALMPARDTGDAHSASAAPSRPVNKHVKSPFSSSNGRAVGASPFKRKDSPVKEEPEASIAEERRGGAGCSDRASSAATGTAQRAVPQSEDCLSESECPAPPTEGSRESESVRRVAPSGTACDCTGIRLLMGRESYYLYDSAAMTDAYARWAFLAAEDDPVATFVECAREESSVYPRPMAVSSLANEPFCMDAAAVEAAFAEARAQGRANDIERIEASNGDVYFYSTRFLSPRRAKALAEWDAVERGRNV